jgi:hypothetical protein
LSIYLTPFLPLSVKGEGEGFWKRGFAPLKTPLMIFTPSKEREILL